jgi:hypothetical protein
MENAGSNESRTIVRETRGWDNSLPVLSYAAVLDVLQKIED